MHNFILLCTLIFGVTWPHEYISYVKVRRTVGIGGERDRERKREREIERVREREGRERMRERVV